MKTYYNFNIKKKHKNSVIAIGNFDGIHLGHQKVILQAKKKAKKNNLPFGVVTFEPMPVMYFNPNIKNHRINSFEQKREQLKKLKLDFLIIINFNERFSNVSAEQFVKKFLHEKINSKFIFVSNNFKFGKNRKGNIKTLNRFKKTLDFKTIVTSPLKRSNNIISSTLIRKNISLGQIDDANKLLNRIWSVEGKVIKGEKRGRKIGFPTCNVKLNDYIVPKLGVYAVIININNHQKKGIANIGYRPTFNGQNLLLEVNIFGINRNLYNKIIKINFIRFIRPERKFKNLEKLKKQIKLDISLAKKYVKR
tara:strand:+ start:4015 stop:4935 length:921 start_codon:yes stop_codon:yes gene_type:complete